LSLLADLLEELGLRVSGDVVGDGEGAVRRGALGVHDTLGDAFAVEVLQLLEQLDVLHEDGPARAGGEGLLFAGGGGGSGGEDRTTLLRHGAAPGVSVLGNHRPDAGGPGRGGGS